MDEYSVTFSEHSGQSDVSPVSPSKFKGSKESVKTGSPTAAQKGKGEKP